jgi:CheY-like chemotaxis protein
LKSESHKKPVEILLVEDNPGDVRLTVEALSEGSVTNNLHVVDDGVKALNFLRQSGDFHQAVRPDMVLLDLNLPKMNGQEVLSAIKADPKLRSIPVVILTTSEAEQDVLRTYDLHANCYIKKPVDFEQFIQVIRSLEDFWFSIVRLPSL